jgi:hypothetical protein
MARRRATVAAGTRFTRMCCQFVPRSLGGLSNATPLSTANILGFMESTQPGCSPCSRRDGRIRLREDVEIPEMARVHRIAAGTLLVEDVVPD